MTAVLAVISSNLPTGPNLLTIFLANEANIFPPSARRTGVGSKIYLDQFNVEANASQQFLQPTPPVRAAATAVGSVGGVQAMDGRNGRS
jgi:hypothetical protein